MNSRGFTLLYSVLAVALMLSAVLSITSITVKQLTLSSASQQSQIAFYAADSGAECMHYWDAKHNAFDPDQPFSPILCGGASKAFTMATDPSDSTMEYAQFLTIKPDSSRQPSFDARVEKINTFDTVIRSSGHNLSVNSPRTVERTLRINYTTIPSQLCFNNGKVWILADLSSTFSGYSNSTLKDELKSFVRRLLEPSESGPTQIGIHAYNSTAGGATVAMTDNVSSLESGINNLPEGGGSVDLARGIQAAITVDNPATPEVEGYGSKGPNNYIVILTQYGPSGASNSITAANNAIAAADAAKKDTGTDAATTTIYTISYNADTVNCPSDKSSTDKCSGYYEKYVAGHYSHKSADGGVKPTNVPYYERYSFVAHTPNDLKAILASLANCR